MGGRFLSSVFLATCFFYSYNMPGNIFLLVLGLVSFYFLKLCSYCFILSWKVHVTERKKKPEDNLIILFFLLEINVFCLFFAGMDGWNSSIFLTPRKYKKKSMYLFSLYCLGYVYMWEGSIIPWPHGSMWVFGPLKSAFFPFCTFPPRSYLFDLWVWQMMVRSFWTFLSLSF